MSEPNSVTAEFTDEAPAYSAPITGMLSEKNDDASALAAAVTGAAGEGASAFCCVACSASCDPMLNCERISSVALTMF